MDQTSLPAPMALPAPVARAVGEGLGRLLLGVDSCGPTGSVALGLLVGGAVQVLAQVEIEGRSYSENLISAIGGLLAAKERNLAQIYAIVAVNGPGSFTGVRLGLSAVKGLAEPGQIPVVAISRLELLASKAGCGAAALDAHRGEVFLRVGERELLAGAEELVEFDFAEAEAHVGVCDEAAAHLLAAAWPLAELVRTDAPTAADALRLCAERVEAGDFADLALLDGHYLRRSDAEIFGDAPAPKARAVGNT